MQMASSSPQIPLLLFFFLLLSTPLPSESIVFYAQIRTLFSLSHSLSTRVANLRDSRGDIDGARRARLIADKLEGGLTFRFIPTLWSMGWDYLRNYAWKDNRASFRDSCGVANEFNELLSSLTELTGLRSDSERAAWVARSYRRFWAVSNSLFTCLLSVFTKSGTVRETVEILQREIVSGAFLKDCLEVGANDLKDIFQIMKDLGFQYGNIGREEL